MEFATGIWSPSCLLSQIPAPSRGLAKDSQLCQGAPAPFSLGIQELFHSSALLLLFLLPSAHPRLHPCSPFPGGIPSLKTSFFLHKEAPNIKFYLIFSYHEWHHLEQMDLGCSLSMCSSVGPGNKSRESELGRKCFPNPTVGKTPQNHSQKNCSKIPSENPQYFPRSPFPGCPHLIQEGDVGGKGISQRFCAGFGVGMLNIPG